MIHPSSRRRFLQTASVLVATGLTGSSFDVKKKPAQLSFSTLGCPDWDFNTIVNFAVQHGYQGIELRGINRELDLTKTTALATAGSRLATIALMKEKGLKFVGLGSSANLHFIEGADRLKNLEEARRFIDLAHQLDCPYVRVFPNNFPKGQEREKTFELITAGLVELANYAKGSKVSVLMETHGDLVKSADLVRIMEAVKHPKAGLIWDISNMWTITREAPAEVYHSLKKYIRHTHIKDANLVEGKLQYTLPGKGEVPIFAAIDALRKDGYNGYYSFEWEKLWHPEIESPEIALAAYPKIMRQHFL